MYFIHVVLPTNKKRLRIALYKGTAAGTKVRSEVIHEVV